MNIGNNIKRLREKRNYSQEYVAHMLQVSQSTFSKIEKGQVRIDIHRLIKLANVLDVRPENLLDMKDAEIISDLSASDKQFDTQVMLSETERAGYDKRVQDLEEYIKKLKHIIAIRYFKR
jgi:transcriptional regulator with XRE-family HTH domain